MRRPLRTINVPLPTEMGRQEGLAYSLWLPPGPARGGVVVLHGAGSCKESHHDYARALIAAGLAAIIFDQRGHGASDGPTDGRVLEDIRAMADVLRGACQAASGPGSRSGSEPGAGSGSRDLPLALRGSSMGGYLALLGAPLVGARAVVAICPASAAGLRRGVRSGALRFDADVEQLDVFFAEHDLHEAVSKLDLPVLLLHAAGDEQVPVQHSRELATRLRSPASRLIVVSGGHHRSIQHDAELQATSVRFIEKSLTA